MRRKILLEFMFFFKVKRLWYFNFFFEVSHQRCISHVYCIYTFNGRQKPKFTSVLCIAQAKVYVDEIIVYDYDSGFSYSQ